MSTTSRSPVTCKAWVVPNEVPVWSTQAIATAEVMVPLPTPTQVRVRVHAAGINPVDYKRPCFSRTEKANKGGGIAGAVPKGRGLKNPLHPPTAFPYPYVAGLDGAGQVEVVGAEVTNFAVGDRVVFHSDCSQRFGGTFCEYALVETDVLVRIPSNESSARSFITYEEAAAIPCATWTAYIALFDKLRVQAGRTIFISGASGGVGSSAVQLAHHFGVFVFASCSPSNRGYVKSLGADVVLDYKDPEAMIDAILEHTGGNGVDYYFEIANSAEAEHISDVLRFGGALCLASGLLVPHANTLFSRQISVHYVFLGGLHGHPLTRPRLQFVGEMCMKLYAEGAFKLKIEVVPFEQCAEALNRLSAGHGVRGKLVLSVSDKA